MTGPLYVLTRFSSMPWSGAPVTAHLGGEANLLSYLMAVLPPGVLLCLLLNDLDLRAGLTM